MSDTTTVSPLRQRMIEDMAARKLNPHTQRCHIQSCKRFAAWLKRSPDTATPDEVRGFQLPLIESGTSICNRNRIMTGVRFLFRVTLRRHDLAAEVWHIKEPERLPPVLSPEEVKRVLTMATSLKARAMLSLAYGCGLRAGEVVRLRGQERRTSTPTNMTQPTTARLRSAGRTIAFPAKPVPSLLRRSLREPLLHVLLIGAIHFEGIISKRVDAPYRSERTEAWLKIKTVQKGKFPVIGFVKDPSGVAALYLGKRDGRDLVYVGKVGTGWSRTVSSQIRKQLDTVVSPKSKLTKQIKTPKATWVEPKFFADVEYRDITSEGLLRASSFKGLSRNDKS